VLGPGAISLFFYGGDAGALRLARLEMTFRCFDFAARRPL